MLCETCSLAGICGLNVSPFISDYDITECDRYTNGPVNLPNRGMNLLLAIRDFFEGDECDYCCENCVLQTVCHAIMSDEVVESVSNILEAGIDGVKTNLCESCACEDCELKIPDYVGCLCVGECLKYKPQESVKGLDTVLEALESWDKENCVGDCNDCQLEEVCQDAGKLLTRLKALRKNGAI
jgi:hypothetical protein